jgi:hypothetical protein
MEKKNRFSTRTFAGCRDLVGMLQESMHKEGHLTDIENRGWVYPSPCSRYSMNVLLMSFLES